MVDSNFNLSYFGFFNHVIRNSINLNKDKRGLTGWSKYDTIKVFDSRSR